MKILFEIDKPTGSYFAIAQKQVYNGKVHEELMFAEIQPQSDSSWKVTWEDDWQNPVIYNDLAQAKSAVIAEHGTRKPYSNGRSYEIE